MEYTKDLILNTGYKEIRHKVKKAKGFWTSYTLEKIKKHKLLAISLASIATFIAIDIMLLINFAKLLGIS